MIEPIAFGEQRRHVGDRLRAAVMRGIVRAPPRALLRRRIEIDLHVGMRKHDGADVAPFHHDAAAGAQLALTRDQHRPHARQPRDRRPPRDRSPACGSRASRRRRRSSCAIADHLDARRVRDRSPPPPHRRAQRRRGAPSSRRRDTSRRCRRGGSRAPRRSRARRCPSRRPTVRRWR